MTDSDAAFEAFLDLWSRDQAVDVEQVCARNREIGDQLRARIEEFMFVAARRPRGISGNGGEHPATIGCYDVRSVLGEGGMGTVYLVEQRKPIQRLCALKVIKTGMDTRRVLGRFDAERQALAMMEHRNIAKVLDAGATEAGQPYFVMEYVDGSDLIEFCNTRGLGLVERLDVFRDVCAGVQHAHQKGVIHRDLKPSNVLVQIEDGAPVPKIIDFGLARAIEAPAGKASLLTLEGQVLGTLEYMSPEQVRGSELDVRSDVYALGGILYEMLTGGLPIDACTLRAMSLFEMQRAICEREPDKPSTRVSKHASKPPCDESRSPSTWSKPWAGRVRGDLDWITLKAIEKDPERRYGSPRDLADDIGRFLRHEPIHARPPGAVRRLTKFVRRHRTGVAVVLVLLAAGSSLAFAAFSVALRETEEKSRARTLLQQGLEATTGGDHDRAESVLARLSRTAPETTEGRLSVLARIGLLLRTGRPGEAMRWVRQREPVLRALDPATVPPEAIPPWSPFVDLLDAAHSGGAPEWFARLCAAPALGEYDRSSALAGQLKEGYAVPAPVIYDSDGAGLHLVPGREVPPQLAYVCAPVATSAGKTALVLCRLRAGEKPRMITFDAGTLHAIHFPDNLASRRRVPFIANYGADATVMLGSFELDVQSDSVSPIGKPLEIRNTSSGHFRLVSWRRSPVETHDSNAQSELAVVVQHAVGHSYHVVDHAGTVRTPPSNLPHYTRDGWHEFTLVGSVTPHATAAMPDLVVSSGEWTQYSLLVLRPRRCSHDFDEVSRQLIGRAPLGCLVPRGDATQLCDLLFAKDSFWDAYYENEELCGRFRSIGIDNAVRLTRFDSSTCEFRTLGEKAVGACLESWTTPVAVASANLDGRGDREILLLAATHARGRLDSRRDGAEITLQILVRAGDAALKPELVLSCRASCLCVGNFDEDPEDEIAWLTYPDENGETSVVVRGVKRR